MCGIGGFSLSKESKINPRVLSNALLTALEDRGYMASGIAWHAPNATGHHKAATPGSGLALKSVPKNTHTAIVHTRLATHGSTTDNRNNHPVLSPSKNIALVHNGVIYNHQHVRSILADRIKFEVDTAVIPALLEQHNHDLEGLRELDGDAAIAWLRDDDHGVLRIARLEHSPLTICQLEDGSFVFASTEALLWRVLVQLDLMPDIMQSVDEYTYLQVTGGVIQEMSKLNRSTAISSGYDYGYYRHQTAGAKGGYAPKKTGNVWYDSYDYGYSAYGDGIESFDDDYWDYAVTKASKEVEPKRFDFLGTPLSGKPAYYIAYRQRGIMSTDPTNYQYAYYSQHNYEDYEDDVSLLEEEFSDYILCDYGIVLNTGELFSDMNSKKNEDASSCELF